MANEGIHVECLEIAESAYIILVLNVATQASIHIEEEHIIQIIRAFDLNDIHHAGSDATILNKYASAHAD